MLGGQYCPTIARAAQTAQTAQTAQIAQFLLERCTSYCYMVLFGSARQRLAQTTYHLETMTTITKAAPVTLVQWIEALQGCLTITHKADGTRYTHLSEAAYWSDIRDDLQAVIFAAHDDEMPNEWRFSMVDHIVNSLSDYGQPQESAWDVEAYREVSWEIAETGADSYTSQNIAWLAENVGRVAFRDEDNPTELLPADHACHIGFLALLRQQEEIEWMVQSLLTSLAALAQ